MLGTLAAAAPPFPFAGETAAIACSLCWAGAQIGFAGIRSPMSGAALNFGKNLVATLAFGVFFLVTTGRPFPVGVAPEPLLWLVVSGAVGLGLCDVFLMQALLRIGPQRTSLVFCIAPVLTVVLAAFPPFDESPALLAMAGMVVTLGGVVMAILERGTNRPPSHEFRAGLRDAVIASFLQAIAVLFIRLTYDGSDVDGAAGAAIRLAAGTATLVLFGLARGRLARWFAQIARPAARNRLVPAALGGTFLGIWLNQLSLQWTSSAGVAATLLSLPPVFLLPLSRIFLRERRAPFAWIATGITFVGVAMIAFA